jgi:hypothetical protein
MGTLWPDLARAKHYEKGILDCFQHFSGRRSAKHGFGMDGARPDPAAFGVDDALLLFALASACSWCGSL